MLLASYSNECCRQQSKEHGESLKLEVTSVGYKKETSSCPIIPGEHNSPFPLAIQAQLIFSNSKGIQGCMEDLCHSEEAAKVPQMACQTALGADE